MKYNSIDNADRFITDQVNWCKSNGYGNFTVWSNGEELVAKIDENDIISKFQDSDLLTKGYWRAIQFENGYRIEI